jgi:integrase
MTEKFAAYVPHYTGWNARMGAKSKLTIDKERYSLESWAQTFGPSKTLRAITRADINRHLEARKAAGRSNRTLNLDIVALGNLLTFAKKEQLLENVVTDDVEPLKHTTPTRELVSEADVEKLCAASPNQSFQDYVKFMMFSGARRESALRVKWSDISLENRRLNLTKTKYSKHIVVNLNPRLEKLLLAMRERRIDDGWLFPNPMEPSQVANFRRTLDAARSASNLPDFQYHSMRHFFISHAIMAGIDTMTVAKWVGHRDNGILIAKVYGHLTDKHLQEQAMKLFV